MRQSRCLLAVGQRVARDLAANAHVVGLVVLGAQTDLDVAQALAAGQLRERHAQELREAGKGLDVAVSAVAANAPAQDVHRQMGHDLGEHELACIHDGQPRNRDCNPCQSQSAVQVGDTENSLFLTSNQCVRINFDHFLGTLVTR